MGVTPGALTIFHVLEHKPTGEFTCILSTLSGVSILNPSSNCCPVTGEGLTSTRVLLLNVL